MRKLGSPMSLPQLKSSEPKNLPEVTKVSEWPLQMLYECHFRNMVYPCIAQKLIALPYFMQRPNHKARRFCLPRCVFHHIWDPNSSPWLKKNSPIHWIIFPLQPLVTTSKRGRFTSLKRRKGSVKKRWRWSIACKYFYLLRIKRNVALWHTCTALDNVGGVHDTPTRKLPSLGYISPRAL